MNLPDSIRKLQKFTITTLLLVIFENLYTKNLKFLSYFKIYSYGIYRF